MSERKRWLLVMEKSGFVVDLKHGTIDGFNMNTALRIALREQPKGTWTASYAYAKPEKKGPLTDQGQDESQTPAPS